MSSIHSVAISCADFGVFLFQVGNKFIRAVMREPGGALPTDALMFIKM